MDRVLCVVVATMICCEARMRCEGDHIPLEKGIWRHGMHHMDTAVIQNPPVTTMDGQLYVYENYFPNRTIEYLHVDNLAMKTCGARASLKAGGVGTSTVLVILEASPYNEIRSVIDIWGTKSKSPSMKPSLPKEVIRAMKTFKSRYLSGNKRVLNHNYRNNATRETDSD